MITKKGWNKQLMASFYKKEGTYNAGVTMNNTNACSLKNWAPELTTLEPQIVSDVDEVTGYEHGSTQELISHGIKLAYKTTKCKPNELAGLAGLCLGSIASTQDGALTAYRHKIIPVTEGTALPSIQVEELFGGVQWKYTGVMGNTFKVSGEAGGLVNLEAELIGSGQKAASATGFVNAVTENWMLHNNTKIWWESGASISINDPPVQGVESISSGSPEQLGLRVKNYEVSWNNNLEGQKGFGGSGYFTDLHYGRRQGGVKFTALFDTESDINFFLNQSTLCLEVDCKGALIAEGGTMYYGFTIIVPKFILKSSNTPKGGVGDSLSCDFEGDVFNDGTNEPIRVYVYNAKAAYLAA